MIKPGRWNAGRSPIEWAWAWRDLAFAWVWTDMGDVTRRVVALPTFTNSAMTEVAIRGFGTAFRAPNSTSGLSFGTAAKDQWSTNPGATGLTILALIEADTTMAQINGIIHKGRGGNEGWALQIESGVSNRKVNLSKHAVEDQISSFLLPVDTPVVLGCTIGTDRNTRYYLDGVLKQTMGQLGAYIDAAGEEGDILVNRDTPDDPVNSATDLKVAAVMLWHREFTGSEMRILSSDPFGPFRIQRLLPVLVPGERPLSRIIQRSP